MIYFLPVLGGEYIKIGYTAQCVEKRKSALQTGNPHEIETLFTVDGTLKQEKEIHRSLTEVFARLQVFNNPVNEWYPGKNPIIKMFMCNVRNSGINYAVRNLNSIFHWEFDVGEDEIFSVRHLEKALLKRGLSHKEAKTLISQNKKELMCSNYREAM
jgi:hypothetical protein